jgi:tRNA(Ile)-lysidine synthase
MSLDGFPRHVEHDFPDLVGRRLLVAVSGGRDSVAMLHLLVAAGLAIELEVAHVHHHARGAEADGDEAFCRRLAGDLALRFHRVDLEPEHSPAEGREAGWRRQRYQALLELASLCGAAAVATAHHRDDIAEGVLVQMLRGGGPRALAGIAPRSSDGRIVRPLLPWGRVAITDWLEARGLSWREDSSNFDLRHPRNWVRHRVLPALEAASPRVREQLVALAAALAEDDTCLAALAAPLIGKLDPWHPLGGVPVAELAAAPRALRTRWLHAEVLRWGIGSATRRQIELLHGMVEDKAPRALALAGRWRLRLARGRIWLEPGTPLREWSQELTAGQRVPLAVPGLEARLGSGCTGRCAWRTELPASERVLVRSPRPDDVVETATGPAPAGRQIAKALPRHLRGAWPVVVVNARIAWIPGVWTAESRPGSGTLPMEVDRT